jgi:DNA-binding PucR family transcriptional regulator
VASQPDEVAFVVDAVTLEERPLEKLTGAGRTIGVGRARTGAEGAARSYAEARRAADFAERLGRPVLRHEELGLFSLLADGGDAEAMADFVDEWLGLLLDHDERRSQKLLPTLAAYLDAGAAQQATADTLGIHVSTLKYRLGRIEAVTGRPLSEPDVRFQLQVAMAAQRTLTVLHARGIRDL